MKLRNIAETTEEEKRIIFKACEAVLPEGWIKTFQNRIDSNQWKESSIWVDCFKLAEYRDAPKQDGKLMVTFACEIPQARPFYDIILGLYVLFKPEVYKDTETAAYFLLKHMLIGCETLKLDYKSFINFGEAEAGYLRFLYTREHEDIWNTFNQPFEAIRFAHFTIKEIMLETGKLTEEEKNIAEENYSKLSEALKEREKQFQNKCLVASAPTSQ